jgi:conjugal transfer/entry exclusion protein
MKVRVRPLSTICYYPGFYENDKFFNCAGSKFRTSVMSSGSSSDNIPWDQQILDLQDEISMLRNLLNEVTETDWNNILDEVQKIKNGLMKGELLSGWCDFLKQISSKTIQNAIIQDYNCFRNTYNINTYTRVNRIDIFEGVLNEMQIILSEIGDISSGDLDDKEDICSLLRDIWHDK